MELSRPPLVVAFELSEKRTRLHRFADCFVVLSASSAAIFAPNRELIQWFGDKFPTQTNRESWEA